MLRRNAILVFAALTLGGCASAGTGPAAQAGGAPSPRRDSNVISAEELVASTQEDLYQVISQLRPAFLVTRGGPQSMTEGAGGPETIKVYTNGVLVGSPEELHQIRPSAVKEVRKLSATDATQKFGTNHRMGAILVTLR